MALQEWSYLYIQFCNSAEFLGPNARIAIHIIKVNFINIVSPSICIVGMSMSCEHMKEPASEATT